MAEQQEQQQQQQKQKQNNKLLLCHEEELDLSDLLHGASLELDDHPELVTAQRVIDCHCMLGEGIVYDSRRHAVLWTDIYGKKLHALQLDYEKTKPHKMILYSTYNLPKMLCSFGLLEGEEASTTTTAGGSLPLLCAWEDGFQIYDVVTGQTLSEMSQGEDVNPCKGPTRLNDGRTDPNGARYVCGGYYGGVAGSTNKEKVFKVEQREDDGTLFHTPIVNEIQTTNSICWTVDGSRMYLADSQTREISSYAYEAATGELSDKQLLHEKPADKSCFPDGSCVDSQGYLWNAVWCFGDSRGMVQRIDPKTGHVVYTVHVPDLTSQVSCCCFGGENMDILFITSAADSRDEKQPHAGALYAVKVPFQGRKESRLKFSYSTKPTTAATATNGKRKEAAAATSTGNDDKQQEHKKARDDGDKNEEEQKEPSGSGS